MKRCVAGVTAVAILALVRMTSTATAQTESDGWNHYLGLYVLGASINGQVSIGPLTAEVEMDRSDVFSNLEMGGMVAYRGAKGPWGVMADLIYMDLGTSGQGPLGFTTELGFDQLLFELDGTRRLSRATELVFGLRYVGLSGDLLYRGPNEERRADFDKSWVDPLVGLRLDVPLGKMWSFVGRGDVGGFGVGSELTGHILASVHFQVSRTVTLAAGYA